MGNGAWWGMGVPSNGRAHVTVGTASLAQAHDRDGGDAECRSCLARFPGTGLGTARNGAWRGPVMRALRVKVGAGCWVLGGEWWAVDGGRWMVGGGWWCRTGR
ncbi:hypothetical protein GCM10022224_001180 [Nonomuraea antimicrobica]|uniref:Uncharacterized protein n=1 Tax=Nonomuraea antimicrobica TaxID=561173 RepID=A0ABP7AX20_9ACTN